MGYYIIDHNPEEDAIRKWRLYPLLKLCVSRCMTAEIKAASDEELLARYIFASSKPRDYINELTPSQVNHTIKAIRLALKELYP